MPNAFLYYTPQADVQDLLAPVQFTALDTNSEQTVRRVRRAIRQSYAEINAALKIGGYTVPVENSTKSLTTGAESASATTTTDVAITAGGGASFAVGNTVRVHGLLTDVISDEFTGIVAISTDTLTLEFLENGYDTGATVELCSEGYLFLANVNAKGAAVKILQGVTVGLGKSKNAHLEDYKAWYDDCLTQIREGEVDLDGLTKVSGGVFISTYHSDNAGASDIPDRTVLMGTEF